MCGIAGILSLDATRTVPPVMLEQMLESIFHRGPDESGRLVDRELSMGMRRLSIIDLADGKQPIFDESGRFGVVFNGEIYNYRELRNQLLSRGHHLKTHSDTEVIVHLFEELGEGCLEHLRGMFGFAIWDNVKRELFIARDRLGIKPLYYTECGGDFVFGSEIKSILEHPALKPAMDLTALSQYLSLKYVPAPRTLFSGIRSLPPGYSMKISNGCVTTKRYWNVSFEKPERILSEQEYADQLLELLRETIRIHLRSDVPFGAFLSGGVDSSTIVALMSEELKAPVKTFSVGFGGEGIQDELPYAQQVADKFGCDHHTLKITSSDFLSYAENVLWHLDQPIADQATVATHMVAKLARQHVKMVLTGEGGDELFAGYARYSGERYAKWFSHLPAGVAKTLRSMASSLPGLRRGKIAFSALTIRNEAERFANWFPMFNDDAKQHLLSEQFASLRVGAAEIFAEHLSDCDATSPVDRMLYVDSKLWLPDYLLLRGDKLTMANSLEARVPLLDHKLVEFAAKLPATMKLHGSQRKYLLKQVARRLLPPEIIDRKKQGFPIPIERWLKKEAKPMMQDLLSSETIHRRGLFDSNYIGRMIREHVSGYSDHSTKLWGLMSVEMWTRKFIDGAGAVSPSSTNSPEIVSDAAECAK